MRRTVLMAIAAIAMGVLTAPTANADPIDCDFTHTCSYDPPYNGPLMPTWDTPGTYGGWTNLPVICDPATYQCHTYVTNP